MKLLDRLRGSPTSLGRVSPRAPGPSLAISASADIEELLDPVTIENVRVGGLEPVVVDVGVETAWGRLVLRDVSLDPAGFVRAAWITRPGAATEVPGQRKPNVGFVPAADLPAALRHRIADRIAEWRREGGEA